MTEPLVRLRAMACRYRHDPVLTDVDLTVVPGTVHALLGLNGAGKTTLLRAVLGIVRPDSGSATVLGRRADTAPSATWAEVGHLLDNGFGYPELTTHDNIRAAARLRGLTRPAADRAADRVIDRLGLTEVTDRRLRRLSLGNRQRVALAAALVHRPRLLVLDEPTIALDPLAVVALREVLREAARDGAGVLVSSHHLDEVARVADDITVLHRGRVVPGLTIDGPDLEKRFFDLVYATERKVRR